MTEVLEFGVAFLPSGRDDYIAAERMGFERYLALEYEHGLAEWVDGEVRLYVSPSAEHQRIVVFLCSLIGCFIDVAGGGKLLVAPFVMRAAPDGPGREPDLLLVSTRNQVRLKATHLEGPADLVVEIVSDDSVRRDRAEKFAEYERAGIPEYWVIDPRPGQGQADFFVLTDGVYQPAPLVDGVIRSEVLPGFWLRPEWLWQENASAMAALGEILGRPVFPADPIPPATA